MRLYHLAADPHEMNDLANDPQYAEKKKQLLAQLRKLQVSLDDSLALPD